MGKAEIIHAFHNRLHSIISPLDHTSAATPERILKADANGLPVEATNTDAEVAAAVGASHARQHDIIDPLDHTSGATPGQILQANASGLPVDATTTDLQVAAAVALAHARQHAITNALDHTSGATPGKMLKADASGLPIEATNTDAEVTDAVTKRHTQGTDTALGVLGTKNPPIDADKVIQRDSAAGDALVTSTWTQIKAFLKTYFDTIYGAIALAHTRLHSITSALDHSSGATPGKILKADANGLPVDATNTDAEVADAVTKRHTQGTDTALGAVGVKNPPIDADKSLYRDSTAGDALVTSTWTQIKAFLKTYWDTLYEAIGSVATHAGLTTGVHGVGAGTVAKVGDIATDANLSAAAQDAIAKRHTQGTDTALGVLGTKNPPIDADKVLERDSAAGDALVTTTWTQIKSFLKTYFDTIYGPLASAHARLHSITSTLDHTSGATPGQILKADANGLPVDAANTDAQVAVAVAAAHARQHAITNVLDHTSGATPGKMLKADANGLPVDATNTDAEVLDAVAKKHTQGTDTALGAVGTKNPPIDADKVLERDSAAGDALVTTTWTQIKSFLKTYFDTIYRLATADHTHQSSGAQAGKLDHGLALDGLSDDDHPQYIKHSLATAISDFLVASGAGVFVKKTLAEVKTILGLGTAAYTAATDYVTHALATAANDFIVASGSGAFVKKTLAETKTILNWAADIATHAGLTATHGVAGTIAGLADIVSYIAIHNALVLSTAVHNNNYYFLGYYNITITDPITGSWVRPRGLVAIADPSSGIDASNWYGASGAYRQADADSSSTKIEDDDASFPSCIRWSVVYWASDAAGTLNTGIGHVTAVDSDTLTISKFTGVNFAASYYYWIVHAEWVVPVTGIYLVKGTVTYYPDEADKSFTATVDAYTGTAYGTILLSGVTAPGVAYYSQPSATGIVSLTAGQHVYLNSAHQGTTGTPNIYYGDTSHLPLQIFLLKQTA
jgi:hypothetical protein